MRYRRLSFRIIAYVNSKHWPWFNGSSPWHFSIVHHNLVLKCNVRTSSPRIYRTPAVESNSLPIEFNSQIMLSSFERSPSIFFNLSSTVSAAAIKLAFTPQRFIRKIRAWPGRKSLCLYRVIKLKHSKSPYYTCAGLPLPGVLIRNLLDTLLTTM